MSRHIGYGGEKVVIFSQNLLHVDEMAAFVVLALGLGPGGATGAGAGGDGDEGDVEGVEGAARLAEGARIAQGQEACERRREDIMHSGNVSSAGDFNASTILFR